MIWLPIPREGHSDLKQTYTSIATPNDNFVQPASRQFNLSQWAWPVKTTPKGFKILQAFRLLIFVSVAVTLSILIPSPWSLFHNQVSYRSLLKATAIDLASEWKDDVWPFRPPSPWDISTDFPFPRVLEYDVQEGTWLRLDVHPKTGDIVFDMLGDLYCLPAKAYKPVSYGMNRAYPILLGVPHDSDPHFSPNGDRIVFRSDAELGIENIWVMEWKGCEEMNVRPNADDAPKELRDAAKVKRVEEDMLASGIKESTRRKRRRLLREGRLGARRVTNETYRWVSDARFHPSGMKIIATKWYTSERSLGAGEGWEYSIPSLSASEHKVEVGSGNRIIGRTLPFGWSAEDYGEQQIGPEQFIWRGIDSLIFSKNVRDENTFTYNKDVHIGIYSIFSRNLTTNRTETLVDAFPGGASRPELSRDGRTLAFVRRVRDKEALVLKDLVTGTIHHVWHGLTYDLSAISAPMGTYPSFAFNPSDDAIIIWAAGQIYHVPLSYNGQGERIALGDPTPIRFTAHIEKRIAETRRGGADIVGLETQDNQRVYSFKELRADDTGSRVVFQAGGATYVQDVSTESHAVAQRIPATDMAAPYYSPSFIHGADDLIIHARWSDTNFTSFEIANLKTRRAYQVEGLPIGRYYSPILCECSGNKRQIAFIKTAGDLLTGNIVATAGAGLYIGEVNLPSASFPTSDKILVANLRFVPSDIDPEDILQMRFVEKNTKLLVQQSSQVFIIDLGVGPNDLGEYVHHILASGRMSKEIVVFPQASKGGKYVAKNVAFVDAFDVYFAPGSDLDDNPVWSKPANATKGLAKLSLDGGHDVTFSRDGKKVFWFLGPFLHSLEVSKLDKCSTAIKEDPSTFGISCVKDLLEYQEIIVRHSTDISRLKRDASAFIMANGGTGTSANADVLVITNATLLTYNTGHLDADLVPNGILIIRGGVFESVTTIQNAVIPDGATVINAYGGFVIPGFIDVHAHWNGFGTRHPAKSWELLTFLAYGVTTLHNPSSSNVDGFVERTRVERGQMIGPRIFHTGDVIYGAGSGDIHQDIADSAEAHSALVRIKAEGGPASFSYKNYNLPSRASRQRLLLAARNFSMLCVPEGGMNQDWDLTYIVDGMTTVEHALPVSRLYRDVLTLYAMSGTGATPTHIVNYGGVMAEQLVWAKYDVPDDPKLRRFIRHDILEGLTETTSRPANSFAYTNTSISIANMVDMGLNAHIGAHGEPPLGLNYHAEMFFTMQGGLNNYEVLRAATRSGAITLGIDASLGSLSPGKLADFLVYPPEVDLLNDDIMHTLDLKYVARGGRLWHAETMEEVWPAKGRKRHMPPVNAE